MVVKAFIRSVIALICTCLVVLPAPSAIGKDRLQAPSFGNLGDSQLTDEFPGLASLLVGGHVIPGLHRNFVPQGVDRLDDGEMVLSGYFCERFTPRFQNLFRRCVKKRSAIYLMNAEDGSAKRLALLKMPDGRPMRLHAGGIAELHGKLWIPDNFVVFRFSLEQLRHADDSVISMAPHNQEPIGVDASGDFITAHQSTLWIGNFQRSRRGNPLPGHYLAPEWDTRGWTAAYQIDPETLRPVNQSTYSVAFGGTHYEVHRPDAALHHRNLVQGMAFLDDRRVVISTSYGPRRSALAQHKLPFSPLAGQLVGPAVPLPDGSEMVVQALNLPTREAVVSMPPGSEGVTWDQQHLAVAFEGGALPYRDRWRLLEDRVLFILPPFDPRGGSG